MVWRDALIPASKYSYYSAAVAQSLRRPGYHDAMPSRPPSPEPTPSPQTLETENARLRAELDALLNQELTEWVRKAHHDAGQLRDFEQSLSWRVTKPLRQIRRIQVGVREVGLRSAFRTGMQRLRSRAR